MFSAKLEAIKRKDIVKRQVLGLSSRLVFEVQIIGMVLQFKKMSILVLKYVFVSILS